MSVLNRITNGLALATNVLTFGLLLALIANASGKLDPSAIFSNTATLKPATAEVRKVTCGSPAPQLQDGARSSVSDFLHLESTPPRHELNVAAFDSDLAISHLVKNPAESRPKQKAFDGAPSAEELPWDAIKPVNYATGIPVQAQPAGIAQDGRRLANENGEMLTSSLLAGWVRGKAITFKGANRARPILHFELWVEAPEAIKQRLMAVDYDMGSNATQPKQQESRDRPSGFRVGFGSLSCVDKIALTLKFNDGRSQLLNVDGCALLTQPAKKTATYDNSADVRR